MVSPEILRHFPISAGLTNDQIAILSKLAEQVSVKEDEVIIHEGNELDKLYLVLKGAVSIFYEVPCNTAADDVAGQLTGKMDMEQIVTSTLGTGELFGFSALLPPYTATSSAKGVCTDSSIIAIDAHKLREHFKKDCQFGYLMLQKVAQTQRNRIRDLHIQSLAFIT